MEGTSAVRRVRAALDPTMEAIVHDLTPLVYATGGSHEHDVPAHVRAASAVRRSRTRLVIVQDDVNVLALHETGMTTEALLLPAGQDGGRVFDDLRGNKQAKMDLEACVVLPDGRLVAFGSGSTRARDRLVVLDDAEVRLVDGRALYEMLRAEPAFSGSDASQRKRAKPWASTPHSMKRRSSVSTKVGTPAPSGSLARPCARKVSRWSRTVWCSKER